MRQWGRRTNLVNLVIIQILSIGNILPADFMIHISLDPTGSNAIDGDLLIAHIYHTTT